jgi:hypothetical protein
MKRQLFALEPATYARHAIHATDRVWAETNCYVDVWVELLHAWGFEPIAALPFTVGIDFEGDQWTFFKFPLSDLCQLYALDVQELAIWRPLVQHVEEQLSLGRPVLVELDSFYLPDTAGTAYQLAHVKSTIAAVSIDVEERKLGYFHGQSYYELSGDDFASAFRLTNADPAALPPYVEIVKRRQTRPPQNEALTRASLKLLARHLTLLPESNPFHKFKTRFAADLEWLRREPLETFHQYAFATLRQFGACYELAATYLGWLQARGVEHLEPSRGAFLELATGAKSLQFQLARAMARQKPLDLSPLDAMATRWQGALDELQRHVL